MVVRSDAHSSAGAQEVPAAFRAAIKGMRAATLRPEVRCEEMPAPQRIAPYATALSADVTVDDVESGTGRLILLYDPAGNDAWDGKFRFVAYCRAEIDLELITDPMLGEVGWSWLSDALAAHNARWAAISGTVTRVASESFGGMADDDGSAQIEVRASWTPTPAGDGGTAAASGAGAAGEPDELMDIEAHVEAWGELLCTAVGLPPVPEGVTAIPSRRGQRGHGV